MSIPQDKLKKERKKGQTIQIVQQNTQKTKHYIDDFGMDVTVMKEKAYTNRMKTALPSPDTIRLDQLETPPFPAAEPQFTEMPPVKRFTLDKKKRRKYEDDLYSYTNRKQNFERRHHKWEELRDKWPDAYQRMQKLQQIGNQMPDIEAAPDAMMQELYNNVFNIGYLEKHHTEETATWAELAEMHGFAKAKDSIRGYLSSDYRIMNEYLRRKDFRPSGQEPTDKEKEIDQAAEAMKLHSLSQDMVVRRNVGMDALAGMLGGFDHEVKEMLKDPVNSNAILTEKGFCSTTLTADFGKHDVEMIILAKKGTNGLWIHNSKGLDTRGEKEVLLAPGTKFQMVDAVKNKTSGLPKWRIFLKTIPQNSAGIPNE